MIKQFYMIHNAQIAIEIIDNLGNANLIAVDFLVVDILNANILLHNKVSK